MKKYVQEFLKEKKYLENYYQKLVYQLKEKKIIGVTNEWFVDNYYMIVEKEEDIKKFFSKSFNYKNAFYKPNLYPIIKEELEKEHYKFQLENMTKYLVKYQKENNV